MIYACMGCKKRYPGCHDICEDYLRDKEKQDRINAKARKEREEEDDYFRASRHSKKKNWK